MLEKSKANIKYQKMIQQVLLYVIHMSLNKRENEDNECDANTDFLQKEILWIDSCKGPINIFKRQKRLAKLIHYLSIQRKANQPKLTQLIKKIKDKISQVAEFSYVFLYFTRILKNIQTDLNKNFQKLININRHNKEIAITSFERNIQSYIYQNKEINQSPEKTQPQKLNYLLQNIYDETKRDQFNLYNPQCLSCIIQLPNMWKFCYDKAHQSIIFLQENEGKYQERWTSAIAAMATKGQGYIFGGILDDIVQGIFIEQKYFQLYRQNLQKSIDSIHPKLSPKQYKIHFLPVIQDYFSEFNDIKNRYVVRIFIDVEDKKKIYYIETDNQGKNKNSFHKKHQIYNEQGDLISGRQIYPYIMKKQKQVRRKQQRQQDLENQIEPTGIHYNEQCKEPIIKFIQHFQKEVIPEQFGDIPNGTYEKKSILMLKKQKTGEQQRQILQKLWNEQKLKFQTNRIFEGVQKQSQSGRILYFVSHERRFTDMEQYLRNNVNQLRDLRFFQIKPLLMLKDNRLFQNVIKICSKLKKKIPSLMVSYFQKLHFGGKNNKGEYKYIFRFTNINHAILLFCHLQAKKIGTNFVSALKSEGILEDQITYI